MSGTSTRAVVAVENRMFRALAVLRLVADLVVAVGLLAATPLVKGEWFSATIPGFWVMGALLAWAVRYGWRGGLVASVALAATDWLIRADHDQGDYANQFLLLIGGPIVGYLV